VDLHSEADEISARAADPRSGEAAAYQAALESAVRSLSQREHSQRELERKLRSKGHAPELVARVLEYLLEHDLQSDARFVEVYIRSRIHKGYGPLKIRQELTSRGISEQELEAELTAPGEFWIEQARSALARKFRQPVADREDWNRRGRFLARRGFPSDLIYRVLGQAD
jgi:regulatory protein